MKKNKTKIINLLLIAISSVYLVSGSFVFAASCGYACYPSVCPQGSHGISGDCQSGYVCCAGTPDNYGGSALPAYNGDVSTTNPVGASSGAGGAYQNQEKIPGSEPTDQFIPYVQSIINFGFAILGILALFMLIIGAYQYLIAAGTGNVANAKETVASALLGLILGMCAWIILNKINPDLVKMRGITPIQGGTNSSTMNLGTQAATGAAAGAAGNGSCSPNLGACQTSNLSCFGAAANTASQICGYESGGTGNPLSVSKTDITKDGKPFSIGLFQLNLTQHDLGMGCRKAFSGTNSNATIINPTLYDQCVTKAQDGNFNISYACQLYKDAGGSFRDWKNTVSHCGL